jgi:enoyl-CoA hydratase
MNLTNLPVIASESLPGVLELRFNKSRSGNALTTELLEHLVDQLETSGGREDVRSVILTGGPILFSIGADVAEVLSPSLTQSTVEHRCRLYRKLSACEKPLIAAVCGPALGGGFEVALAADIIVAGESARFGLPETALGIIPAGGGTQRLVRVAGKSLAMQMTLAGKELSAHEARDAGIVSEVVPDQECLPRARAIAAAIAQRPTDAVRCARHSILAALEHSLERGLMLEQQCYLELRDIKTRFE